MVELLIRNGYVFDPLNGIDGEIKDIAVRDGKIVDSVSSRAMVVDASEHIVMPGGVDIHSHIAGPKVNAGRLLRPEDHYKDVEPKTSVTRSGVGHSIPSVFTTGYRYARMGYTTVIEPATAPIETRHTHEELNDIPMIDKACFPLLGNNWFVMGYAKDGKVDECAAFVAWMINSLKGYAIKIVNAGGVEAWSWGRNVLTLDDEVPRFGVTPREIIRCLCKVNTALNLPHATHVHANNIGWPGNYETTIETMKCVEDLAREGKPVIHITHCQFNAFAGRTWATLASGAEEIAKYVNGHDHVTIDTGQIIFTDTTTMTADGPFQYALQLMTGGKWVNADVEAETGAGIVPIKYKRRSYVNAVQWSIALELALLIKDPWKVYLTTDHPNGGPFTAYPRVISWLINSEARKAVLAKLNKRAVRKSLLPSIDREYTLGEIATVTRAGTAKSLGLKNKGHLGVGADADISIYAIDLRKVDPSKDYATVRKAFRKAAYTIKAGYVVVKDGVILRPIKGDTHWNHVKVSPDLASAVTSTLRKKFKQYYTIQFDNYPIDESYLEKSRPMEVEATV